MWRGRSNVLLGCFLRSMTTNSVLKPRPPVVTIMGHVDHGKTTLLDYLRNSSVAASEAGGITQHIGAFSVEILPSGSKITFLDTPGHAAFEKIRERGAQVTDIVVLVVSLDDGVMAQTIESIKFATKAQVPIITALNKCDKFGTEERVRRVKEDLLKYEVVSEEFGGETQTVAVSALKGINMDKLLECILLQGELLELKADFGASVKGTVIEASTKVGLGFCATILVQQGTLKIGDILVGEDAICKVRVMRNHCGEAIKEASPSTAVEIAGWRSIPRVGVQLDQYEKEAEANEAVEIYQKAQQGKLTSKERALLREREALHDQMWKSLLEKNKTIPKRNVFTYEDFNNNHKSMSNTQSDPAKLSIILKTDVVGTTEALEKSIKELSNSNSKRVMVDIISSSVGAVTETDIENARIFKAKIYTFGQKTSKSMLKVAERAGVDLREFNIIYRLLDQLKVDMISLLPVEYSELKVGEASVLQTFTLSGSEVIAGCRVENGNIIKSSERIGPDNYPKYFFRLQRNGKAVWEGSVESMRHLKKEINNATSGLECGLALSNPPERILAGDRLLCIERQIIQASL